MADSKAQKNMSFEKQMYEVQEKWEESYFSEGDKRRVNFVYSLFPAETSSLLDVGCGNGILVNYLNRNNASRFERICATDRSETSLRFVETEKVRADINDLPFGNGEFDIVTCLEVIEHLPQDVYLKALNELKRVAKKYVILSVPNAEDLVLNRVTCPKCTTAFSPFYHMRSFAKSTFSDLLDPEFKSLKIETIEKLTVPMFPRLKQTISRWMHPEIYPHNCICPMCGYNEFEKLKSMDKNAHVGQAENVGIQGLSRFWPHHKVDKWIVALFERK